MGIIAFCYLLDLSVQGISRVDGDRASKQYKLLIKY